ncbi:YkgJ family cysteine cluster protein [Thermodesulforhabdus norvegica]|uniref:Putative zinc-or iron-chelating domain-containing protein n=1 Tax=Thermodesulforhabdus norvegica TaxID=39841 RepID=A0A1I4TSL0_9BACT|nr:YkgJ family cysteine cluster protein [Thermodesulforhabdus norvegica]SFM79782.1 Putative zinc-or iron-chelating domain-containing protein [Thermodesulforhabdus norvegica]
MSKKHTTNPSEWSLDQLLEAWKEQMKNIVADLESLLPVRRLQLQVESHPEALQIFRNWESAAPSEKVQFWKELIEITRKESLNPLPACVQCGECCRGGSPSLYLEDLELLRSEKIPMDRLVTLRRGEPVRDPRRGKAHFLIDERIKIKEKPGSNECVFFDPVSCLCGIYENRPLQCRAQACWDPSYFNELSEQPYLTRRDVLGDVELLMDLLQEHDRKCSFERLHALFQRLSRGEEVAAEIIDLVSYESHFRNFVASQLNIPEGVLDFVFGRSLESLLPLFGCRLRIENNVKYLEVLNEGGE